MSRLRALKLKRWGGCWGGLTCFGKQKGGKRIVPASRIPEANQLVNQPNGTQAGALPNQTTGLAPSLLAPPSSPASFSHSALPSTAQSPNCFLSANSPGGPSSTMFATGPYAHETQLVSPPVFSTFTTEPSTAPLTPPPELAHLTTPSSPDVPFAQFLTSSVDLKGSDKANYIASNDLQATYSLYPGSPASSFISPVSISSTTFPEKVIPSQWDPSSISEEAKYARSESVRLFDIEQASAPKSSQDSNFFCPATFAQFYLDPSSFPQSGGRLSVSRESDAYSNGVNGHQSRQNKPSKQDAEELEAYRASFGFSADEIVTTTQYVEISDVMEDSFTMNPFTSVKHKDEESILTTSKDEWPKPGKSQKDVASPQYIKSGKDQDERLRCQVPGSPTVLEGYVSHRQSGDISVRSAPGNQIVSDDEDIFSKMGATRIGRKYNFGLSSSDAEIEYRRGRSLREGKGEFARKI